MKLFDKIFNRSAESPSSSELQHSLESWGALKPGSGYITDDTALALSAVWACVRILSSSVSFLPVHLYRRTASGRERVSQHPAYTVLRNPSDWWSCIEFLNWLMTSALLQGNGYARIYRDSRFRPVSLKPYKPWEIAPYLDDENRLWYYVSKTGELLYPYEVIHLKGLGTDPIKGLSPISVHRQNLTLAREVQVYGQNFFEQGGNTEGVFTIPGTLKKEQYDRLKADVNRKMAGVGNAHSPWILEGGMSFQRINIPLEDAQFLGTRKFQKTEIATIFGVPPHMIADLERSTNNNIEHQGMEYVTYSLMPWLVKLEEEFRRKLLYDAEGDLYFKFNANALLRGDANSRSNYYKNMYMVGALNANEIRELEDMNPYNGGEKYFAQANMNMLTPDGPAVAKDNDNGKEE